MSNENKHGISHVTPVDANIFEELGFDHAEAADLLLRAQLELALEKRIEAKRLMLVLEKEIKSEKSKRSEAAEVLGVSKPAVSNLVSGKINKFSVDTLSLMLDRVGRKTTFRKVA